MQEAKDKPGFPTGHINLILAVVAVAISGLYSWGITRIEDAAFGDPVGSKAFPELVTIGLLISAVMMFIEYLRERASSSASGVVEWEPMSWVVIISVVWTALYLMLFEPLGFIVSTVIYLTTLMTYFDRRKPWINLLVAVLFTGISYFLLAVLLQANLPKGNIPFLAW